jgi:hypothetical protein
MFEESQKYKKPMVDFLNIYTKRNRHLEDKKVECLSTIFKNTTELFYDSVEGKIFRPVRALNVALYEAAMVGLAFRLTSETPIDNAAVKQAHSQLLEDSEFLELTSKSTTDITNVEQRLEIAKNIFMEV